MKKRLWIVNLIVAFVLVLSLGLSACGDNGNTGDNGNNGNNGSNNGGDTQTVAVTSVELNETSLTLDIGDTATLTATVKPDNATNKTVTWSSDKTNIATVANGKVTAVAEGTATITATADGKSATCTVKVNGDTDTPVTPTPENPDTPTKYTVTFEPNGGTFANGESTYSVQVNEGEKVGSVTVTREKNYKFLGWYSDEEHTVLWDFDNDTVTKAITLYAGWEYVNPYQPIIDALKPRVREEKSFEDAEFEILFIYEETISNNWLAFKIKTDKGVYDVLSMVKTDGYSLSVDNIDTEYYVSAIADSYKVIIRGLAVINDVYTTDGTVEEQLMVSNMITKLLGDDYNIIYGGISATRENGATSIFGGADAASFDVYALLEKDGIVFEYEETLTVNKNYGDVYQAVLNSTEANKDNVYRDNGKTPVDLGEVAASSYAEFKKEQEANQNIVA